MGPDRGEVAEYDFDQLTTIFRLLSDKTRLTILVMLARGEKNVGTLCTALDLPQPTVSHHLGLLRTSNVITNRRAGKQVFYSLNGQVGSEKSVLKLLMESYEVQVRPKAIEPAVTLAG